MTASVSTAEDLIFEYLTQKKVKVPLKKNKSNQDEDIERNEIITDNQAARELKPHQPHHNHNRRKSVMHQWQEINIQVEDDNNDNKTAKMAPQIQITQLRNPNELENNASLHPSRNRRMSIANRQHAASVIEQQSNLLKESLGQGIKQKVLPPRRQSIVPQVGKRDHNFQLFHQNIMDQQEDMKYNHEKHKNDSKLKDATAEQLLYYSIFRHHVKKINKKNNHS